MRWGGGVGGWLGVQMVAESAELISSWKVKGENGDKQVFDGASEVQSSWLV